MCYIIIQKQLPNECLFACTVPMAATTWDPKSIFKISLITEGLQSTLRSKLYLWNDYQKCQNENRVISTFRSKHCNFCKQPQEDILIINVPLTLLKMGVWDGK